METKKELRTNYKKMRNEIPEETREELSAEICGHILGSRLYQQAEIIFAYYPLGNEVSLLPVIEDALSNGKRIAFPKVEGEDMEFYQVKELTELKEGYYHVMEPVTESAAEEEDALVLTPGVVFDMDGNRIGYGKGFYDRYLDRHPECITLGIAYEAQIVESFEADMRDKRMDYIVTELGIRRINDL